MARLTSAPTGHANHVWFLMDISVGFLILGSRPIARSLISLTNPFQSFFFYILIYCTYWITISLPQSSKSRSPDGQLTTSAYIGAHLVYHTSSVVLTVFPCQILFSTVPHTFYDFYFSLFLPEERFGSSRTIPKVETPPSAAQLS